jgi:hypothetical protein
VIALSLFELELPQRVNDITGDHRPSACQRNCRLRTQLKAKRKNTSDAVRAIVNTYQGVTWREQ